MIMPRKKVDIPDDTWLEALKFLTFPQWWQKRFVCHQVKDVAVLNVPRLPKMVIDNVEMYHICSDRSKELKKLMNKYTTVAFDTVMQEKPSTQWFKNPAFTLDVSEDTSAENALIGVKEWKREWKSNVNICVNGPEEVNTPLSIKDKRLPWFYHLPYVAKFRKPVFYYAQFNPVLNPYSWEYLAQFLKLIYHPSAYLKHVTMFAVNQGLIDSQKFNTDSFNNELRFIRCESFSLEGIWAFEATSTDDLSNSLKWMTRNVRAEKIHIPRINCDAACVLVVNFLLDPSGAKQCASKEVHLRVHFSMEFLIIFIQAFYTIPFVESAIPTIIMKYWPSYHYIHHALGRNWIYREVDSQGADALYIIPNGQNRMRISFRWEDRLCNISIYSI